MTIEDRIHHILYHEWDPIGVAGSAPEDEYDSYISGIYKILIGSRSKRELVDYLDSVARDAMGLSVTSSKHAQSIAQRLLDLEI